MSPVAKRTAVTGVSTCKSEVKRKMPFRLCWSANRTKVKPNLALTSKDHKGSASHLYAVSHNPPFAPLFAPRR
jgi:hypothetical protein